MNFRELQAQLRHAKYMYMNGKGDYAEVQRLARQAADAYNEFATETAERFNQRPRLTTAATLIRNTK